MVVILNNFSFQLARCMLNFRDAGIKKARPLCMADIKKQEPLLTVDLMKKKEKATYLISISNLFSVAIGRVRPNIKLMDTCGSRLIASRQLLTIS